MIQYLVILLDDTSVSFCHYSNGSRKERRLMPLETLKAGIVYAMKENLSIQFVYPAYELPQAYREAIDSIDHTDIKPANLAEEAEVVVFDGWEQTAGHAFKPGISYVLRTDRQSLFAHIGEVCTLLSQVERLNLVITDVEQFTDADFDAYAHALKTMADAVEERYLSGQSVQVNLLTDRMMLDKMNNCGAGDTAITLAPDGQFYVCPAFYLAEEADGHGKLKTAIGDLRHGLDMKNPQLYRLDHAPICRHCDAFQCKRCVWLNRRTTYEVNTPSHEQCVMAHLEREASRVLLEDIRKHGTFLPKQADIKKLSYLDPFEVKKEWDKV